MGGCAKHLQGTWTDQRQGELLREITLNTMVRINTNRSSIPELLRQCAQEGRGHVWHPNKIHSEKAWTCLKMESSATKVWFGQSKKSYIVRGNLLWFSAANFCVFFRNSFQRLCRKVTLGGKRPWVSKLSDWDIKYQAPSTFCELWWSVPQSEGVAVEMLCSGRRQLIIILDKYWD